MGDELSTEPTGSEDIVHDNTQGGTEGNPHSLSAELSQAGVLLSSQVPDLAITNTETVADQSERLSLDPEEGDVVIQNDNDTTYMFTGGDSSLNTNWSEFVFDVPVDSVHGRTGAITAQQGDYSASDVTNAVSDTDLSDHESSSSGVHGVGTSNVESESGAQSKVDSHEAKDNPHSDSLDVADYNPETDTHNQNHGSEDHNSDNLHNDAVGVPSYPSQSDVPALSEGDIVFIQDENSHYFEDGT